MLQRHDPGAKLLRVYQRFHGILHPWEKNFHPAKCSTIFNRQNIWEQAPGANWANLKTLPRGYWHVQNEPGACSGNKTPRVYRPLHTAWKEHQKCHFELDEVSTLILTPLWKKPRPRNQSRQTKESSLPSFFLFCSLSFSSASANE